MRWLDRLARGAFWDECCQAGATLLVTAVMASLIYGIVWVLIGA